METPSPLPVWQIPVWNTYLSLSAHLFFTVKFLCPFFFFAQHIFTGLHLFFKECEVSKWGLMSFIFQRDGHRWHSILLWKSFWLLQSAQFLQTQRCWRDFTPRGDASSRPPSFCLISAFINASKEISLSGYMLCLFLKYTSLQARTVSVVFEHSKSFLTLETHFTSFVWRYWLYPKTLLNKWNQVASRYLNVELHHRITGHNTDWDGVKVGNEETPREGFTRKFVGHMMTPQQVPLATEGLQKKCEPWLENILSQYFVDCTVLQGTWKM